LNLSNIKKKSILHKNKTKQNVLFFQGADVVAVGVADMVKPKNDKNKSFKTAKHITKSKLKNILNKNSNVNLFRDFILVKT
jgi:hypothetical protein